MRYEIKLLQDEKGRKNTTEEKIERYTETLKRMVDCKTVYTEDMQNKEEYLKFYQVLETAFPLLHKKAKRMTFGTGCFVYFIEGKDAKKKYHADVTS